ncbi:MAG TPA: redox-regulated ATPase YchF [Candidatus Saccharimonadales bacterium]|nr:redox-regulated ATPase YchF [Candidatus Saccharimonadales bacterium]
MSLAIGIVGLPNVGKSTLFNALLKRQAALAANYPFATIEPNVGVVDVPDFRLLKLAEIVKSEYGRQAGDREVPEKIIPATVKFYDIAGLVKGASQGEGLGNQFLSHIREVDAIVHVIRDFTDENVIRAGSVSPKEDIDIINTELILADLQVLDKRYSKIEQDLKRSKSPEDIRKLELYKHIKEALDKGSFPVIETEDDKALIADLNLLTLKPIIYVYNISESDLKLHTGGDDIIRLSAQIESELSSFSEEEKQAYLSELGITESGLDKVIKKGFDVLGLQTFLTAGPKEVRAWTIKKDAKAPQAAGAIHTDFERGFISAEIISFEDLIKAGGWKVAKDKGLVRIEGKNYTMRDGDVVEFRFSV